MEVERKTDVSVEQQHTLTLSEEAQKVLQIALNEAVNIGRGYFIDTADLLTGLSQIGMTGELLHGLGITTDTIREARKDLGAFDYFNRLHPSTTPTAITRWEQIPRTDRLHKIGRMVTSNAVLAGKDVIEPDDILRAIVQEGWGMGARVINHLGIDRSRMLTQPYQ